MKRIVIALCVLVAWVVGTSAAHASWSAACYSGYQPWWNIFAKRYKCLTPEEERLQKFWHDYDEAPRHYYAALERIDWVAYYKAHGYPVNSSCPSGNCGRVNYAPVFVSPTLHGSPPAAPAGPPGGGRPLVPPVPSPALPGAK
jgi:hypothetical protein